MDRYWLLTSTTFGTWLPGDARGFVSDVVLDDGSVVRHNIPGTEYDRDHPDMVAAARERMKGPPIYFNTEQARIALDSFVSAEAFRGWAILAGSVMCNHFHLVVGVPGDPEPKTLLQKLKSWASHCLNEKFSTPPSEAWWTRGGSCRKLPEARAVLAATRYTVTQHGMLAMYLCSRERFSSLLGEPTDIDLWRAGDDSPR